MPFAATDDPLRKVQTTSPLAPMCEVTGGKCHIAQHLKHAFHIIETIGKQWM